MASLPLPPAPKLESLELRGGGKCTLLGEEVDVLMQVVLFFVSWGTLVAKWWFERDRRPAAVFACDAMKQGAGFLACHVFNVLSSVMLISRHQQSECVWYAINVSMDCTVRVYVAFLFLQAAQERFPAFRNFGVYSIPPTVVECGSQTALWLGLVLASRLVIAVGIYIFRDVLSIAFGVAFAPLEAYSAAHGHTFELFFVMVLLPTALNVAQLLVQDSFLRAQHRWYLHIGSAGKPAAAPLAPAAAPHTSYHTLP
eukprot:TRINITY_DN18663_c0_g1_i1.p1 TRINITY_DN18663_c0_g1~~TRINITY_DN18663_c0_g1_i1.p1  ORF type:complete len:255 (+),score=88.17 TRINITY_DN18663_c0_g1_i1:39-803(+)